MNLKQFKKKYGVTVYGCYPAENGEPRNGLIRKMVRFRADSCWQQDAQNFCTIGYSIDTEWHKIAVYLLDGAAPYAKDLFQLLLSDRDVRREVINYQKRGRKDLYKIVSKKGMSGCIDVYIKLTKMKKGGFSSKVISKKLLHVSCNDKLNEGFGENSSMYIGDFAEVAAHLGYVETIPAKLIKRKLQARYLVPRLAEDVEDFDKHVTKIF